MGEPRIMDELLRAATAHHSWASLTPQLNDESISVHLAVMLEPFLRYIFEGKKTIESRFAKNAIAPYESISPGDLVLLKAGPVVGSFMVSSVNFVVLHPGELERLRTEYANAICACDDAFWDARTSKRYATLMGVENVRILDPIPVPKRDMRGWVVVRPAVIQTDDLLSLL